jgi:uncharacterized membrane protein
MLTALALLPSLPPLPAWNAAHPIVVHLPIGVLTVGPVFVVWAMLGVKTRRAAGLAALIVLVVGCLGLVLATASGDAAEHIAVVTTGPAGDLLDAHEEAGELARNAFLGLGGFYAVVMGLVALFPARFTRPLWIGAHALVLAAYAVALLLLIDAGHMGGRLVHEHGIRAPMVDAPPPQN